jgi:hypothetical protein
MFSRGRLATQSNVQTTTLILARPSGKRMTWAVRAAPEGRFLGSASQAGNTAFPGGVRTIVSRT